VRNNTTRPAANSAGELSFCCLSGGLRAHPQAGQQAQSGSGAARTMIIERRLLVSSGSHSKSCSGWSAVAATPNWAAAEAVATAGAGRPT
jgi:hypothetical protein